MANAYNVARFLIRLAAGEDEPDYLTHLRMQKLLYYVQGWSLAERGEPLFPEKIEAWFHGPVVRDVYASFVAKGFGSLLPEEDDDTELCLETDEVEFISSIWDDYKGYSATKLREMTHEEPPWVDARRGLKPLERSDREITQEAMRSHFVGLAQAH